MNLDPRHVWQALQQAFGGHQEQRRPLTRAPQEWSQGDITFPPGSQPRFWSDIDPRFNPQLRGAGDQVRQQFLRAPVQQGPQRQWWSDQGGLWNVQPRLDMAHNFEQTMRAPQWSPSQPTFSGGFNRRMQ